ncbi:protein kinase [Nonomuraea sp. NPDC047897]|uniref:serine/threonine-protein kinase n=1 Tax=Nonomuraea sp. NPDC047897 TaxID=3364346 RepID=UPI00371557A3
MSESAGMVGGRYRLLRTIGQGGMGTVWQAHDEVLGRDVAVKEVHPPPDLTGAERDVFSVRTFREARAAGRVAHPGVAAVYDVLEERGHPWIVMQFVRSRTLGQLVRDDGPLPPSQAAAVGLQLLEALHAAHAAGVLHRDVKPDNVLLTDDGRAVLTDFGIATTEDEAPVTRTGILLGTPAFISPERAAGGQATQASDLWSLGVTLYVAVEGHSPFQRPHALATLGAVMHDEPAPLSRAGALGPVLLGLLRKDPAERMTLDEARMRLHAIVAGSAPEPTAPVAVPPIPRQAPPPGATPPVPPGASGPPAPQQAQAPPDAQAPPSPRRRTSLLALAAGVVAVGLATGGTAWWSQRDGADRPPATVPAVVNSPKPSAGESRPSADPRATEPATGPTTQTATGPAEPRVLQSEQPPDEPRSQPTAQPRSDEPNREPNREPTRQPTRQPTKKPTEEPSREESGDRPASRDPGQVEPSSDGGDADAGKSGENGGNAQRGDGDQPQEVAAKGPETP